MRRQAGLAAIALALLLGACTAGPQQNAESPEGTSGAAPAPSELPDSALLQPPGTEEYTAAIAECMIAAGFGATVSSDSITYDPIPSEQRSQFDAASETCALEAAPFAPVSAPITDALLRLNYDRNEAAAKCLEENGFSTPSLGSYQEWLDDLYADAPYDAFADVRASELSGGATVQSVEQKCPAPDRFFLDPTTMIYESEVDYEAYRRSEG